MTDASTSAPREPGQSSQGAAAIDSLIALAEHWKLLLMLPLAAGLLALGIAFLITPTFTARTTFLSPQQPQSTAASAIASLGSLAGVAGGALGVRNLADQYVALMQSTVVSDRIIQRFDLLALYDEKYRIDARKQLANHVRITPGKKDNLITVEVDDKSPQRASDMANAFVEELHIVTSRLAVTEAQQRRLFFEKQLQDTKTKLTEAQIALQASGFTQGALKAEPKAAAEGYAKLKAEATAAEVRLQTLRGYLNDNAVEMRQAQGLLAALRAQVAKAEQPIESGAGPDYIGKYREFKYQETLFDLFSRQYELARVDESREGALIQVVDVASPPERKSKPYRSLIAVVTTLASGLLIAAFLVLRQRWRAAASDPQTATKLIQLRSAWGRR
jgi:uncharacterized protein involved in exopolysaccharide biosynthesis